MQIRARKPREIGEYLRGRLIAEIELYRAVELLAGFALSAPSKPSDGILGCFGACSNTRAAATKRLEACAGGSNILGQGVAIDFRINHVPTAMLGEPTANYNQISLDTVELGDPRQNG